VAGEGRERGRLATKDPCVAGSLDSRTVPRAGVPYPIFLPCWPGLISAVDEVGSAAFGRVSFFLAWMGGVSNLKSIRCLGLDNEQTRLG
jgi:hypothetical protein